jgi:hypothetical protein
MSINDYMNHPQVQLCDKCSGELEPASLLFNGVAELTRGNMKICYQCYHNKIEVRVALERPKAMARVAAVFNACECKLHLQSQHRHSLIKPVEDIDAGWDNCIRAYEEDQ